MQLRCTTMGTRDERGAALVVILGFLSALVILSVGVIHFARTEIQIADNSRTHTGALYVAEAGINEVMTRMALTPGTLMPINGDTIDPYIGDDPQNPDPSWKTEVHLAEPSKLPKASGTEIVVATTQPKSSWLHYGDRGEGMEPIAIEHKWNDRNGDGVRDANEIVRFDPGASPRQNFAKGNPVDVITATGMFNGSRRTIMAEAVSYFRAGSYRHAALFTDEVVKHSSHVEFCGHNHDVATPSTTSITSCYPFERCSSRTRDAEEGCVPGIASTGDPIDLGSHGEAEGFPIDTDSSSVNVFPEIHEVLGLSLDEWNETKQKADHTSMGADPLDGFTYIEGDAHLDPDEGSGLLYVSGDLHVNGHTNYRGLIYVDGETHGNGHVWVLGSMLIRGDQVNGKVTVLYSSESIERAIETYRKTQVDLLSWKEL
ncbi:MAG: hypothetical protein ACRDGR_08685 [bacterium]